MEEKPNRSGDLRRLTKSKSEVDISPNTLRGYARHGLNLYRMGKAVFYSLTELEAHIKLKGRPGPKREAT
jgi:hypothetical protein